ncbi:Gfo/Idh/MocA family oxidoreductase [Paludibacter sp.]
MKKVRFGIVGTNFISDWIIEGARQDSRFELVAIYSRSQQTAKLFAEKHNILLTFTSLEEMARSSEIDAVYIASPNALHASQSIMFMEHKKHVLCEKPLASNANECRLMIDSAKRNEVTLMEAMKPTLTPNFRAVLTNIKEIGKINHYFASFCQYSSRYEKYKNGISVNAFDPALSNGAIMDIGVYTIYPMVVLFGKPIEIKSLGVLLSTGTDGSGTVNFKFSNGLTATIIYSKISDSTLSTEIQGNRGNIIIDKISSINKVELLTIGDVVVGKGRLSDSKTISIKQDYNEYFYEVNEFINLIENKQSESEINSLQNSLITMEIIDEIRKQLGVVFPADNY